MDYVNCNLCGANDHVLIHRHHKDRYCNPKVEIRLVICKNCGMVYANPQLDESDIRSLYSDTYANVRSDLQNKSVIMAYESYFEDRLKWIEKRLNFANGTKRCLDVGCGAGCFTSVFQKAGWDAYGLESIQHYAEFARTRYGIKVINGFIEDAQLPESYFDMVTLHSVLEHLRNPIQALLRIRNLVKPQGYIYIRVPNVLKPESLPYFEAPHLYMFSPKTLSLALRKTGFQAAYLESGYKVHALAQKGNLPVNIDYATEGDDYRKVVKVVKLNNMRLFLKQRVRPKLRFIAVRTLGQSNEQRIIHLIRRVVH